MSFGIFIIIKKQPYSQLIIYSESISLFYFINNIGRSDIIKMYKADEQNQEQQKIKNFYDWLLQGNATFPKAAIEVETPGRRNVVSTKHIKRGETIVYIPKDQIISLLSISHSQTIQNIFNRKLKLHSPKHCLLAIYLLEQKQDHNSLFKAYIETLPLECSNFPIFYSQEEMKQLKGSPLFEAVEQRKFQIQQDYKCLTQKDIGFKISYDDFCWARMIVCSRIFGIVIGDQKTDALVPLADMLNHSTMKQTIWSYSNNREGFVIQSLQSIPKGVQIFDSYGRKSNSRFLLNYGFVLDNNDSDQIQFKLKIDRKLKNKLLEICEQDPTKFIFKLGIQFDYGCFEDLLSTIRFIEDVKTVQQVSFQQPTNNKTTFRQPTDTFTSCQNELKCWNYLHGLFLQMLDEYPSSLQQDLRILQCCESSMSFNSLNCLKLRIGQKKIIKYYIQICTKMQELFQMSAKGWKKSWKSKSYHDFSQYLSKLNELMSIRNC